MRLNITPLSVLVATCLTFRCLAQDTVEVTASGQGAGERNAIYEALLAAIAQHSGMSIETEKELRRLSLSREDNTSASASIDTSLAERIKTATKGEVLGYTILERGMGEDGLVKVTLSAKLGVYLRSEQTERRRIAVPGFHPGGAGAEFDRLVSSKVASLLSQTRRFAVLERNWDAESAQEAALLRSGASPGEERVRLGQRLGADYLLIGTVTKLSLRENNGSAESLLSPVASCLVDFRLVEFATGQIKVARVVPAQLNSIQARAAAGGLAGIEPSVALAQAVAALVAETITDAAYPITIVNAPGEGEEIALNQGGERLKVGARYTVLALGEALVDPQTKESLGRAEAVAGVVEVTRVAPKTSYAKVIEQKRRIEAGMIVRAAAPAADPSAGKLRLRNDNF